MPDIPNIEPSAIIANREAIVEEVKTILAKKAARKALNDDIKAGYSRLEVFMSRFAAKNLEKVMAMSNDQQQDFFTDMIGVEQIIENLNILVREEEDQEEEQEPAAA